MEAQARANCIKGENIVNISKRRAWPGKVSINDIKKLPISWQEEQRRRRDASPSAERRGAAPVFICISNIAPVI